LAEQEADWRDIRRSEPDAAFCLMRDLNQDLLPTGHYYGSTDGRCALRASLARAGLACLTAEAIGPAPLRASIDHICASGRPLLSSSPHVWPSPDELGGRLTDHHGVTVTIESF
jgi:hypothetical protein